MTSPGSVFSPWPSVIPKWDLDHAGLKGKLSTLYVHLDDISFDDWLERVPPEGLTYARALGVGYFRFVLDTASMRNTEKVQISPLVGDSFSAITFGAAPPELNVQGFLYNTKHDQWWDAFSHMYWFLLRASRTAASSSKITLTLDSRRYTGIITGMQESINAADQTRIPISFTMLVSSAEWDESDAVAAQLTNPSGVGSVSVAADVAALANAQSFGVVNAEESDDAGSPTPSLSSARAVAGATNPRSAPATDNTVQAPIAADAERSWALAAAQALAGWDYGRAASVDGANKATPLGADGDALSTADRLTASDYEIAARADRASSEFSDIAAFLAPEASATSYRDSRGNTLITDGTAAADIAKQDNRPTRGLRQILGMPTSSVYQPATPYAPGQAPADVPANLGIAGSQQAAAAALGLRATDATTAAAIRQSNINRSSARPADGSAALAVVSPPSPVSRFAEVAAATNSGVTFPAAPEDQRSAAQVDYEVSIIPRVS